MPIQRHANFSQAHFSNDISGIFDKKSGTLGNLIGRMDLRYRSDELGKYGNAWYQTAQRHATIRN